MGLIAIIYTWWDQRCRQIDLEILWPECKKQAADLDHAKAAFALHAFNDSAWMRNGEEWVKQQIDSLE